MLKNHENYGELVWMLAKTDFKLRYHGSVLGYLWALLKPLSTFAILNFVFSYVFNSGGTYSLQLLIGLVIFFFFSEGTSAGMASLLSKSQLVTKIYVPRWAIIVASTVNAAMIFLMNLAVIALFFAIKGFVPNVSSIVVFFLFSFFTYVIIVSFSLVAAPLYAKLRDLLMLWDVLLLIIMYSSPIIYPLSIVPEKYHSLILLNPLAFIINYSKDALINNHFAPAWQFAGFSFLVALTLACSVLIYMKIIPKVAEEL